MTERVNGGAEAARRLAVGIDTGGTFTDCVLIDDDGGLVVAKVPSTPANPAEAIVTGLERLCEQIDLPISSLRFLAHGTTVATNAMLEERWAEAGLLTTAGFRDLLEIGSQIRPELYGTQQHKPRALVARERRFEVRERLAPDGSELEPLADEDVRAAIERLVADGVEGVAVCFLFSYASGAHEARARELARELAPDLYVCISSEVSPEIREYARTSTTVINAALAPIVRRYLRHLREGLDERAFPHALHVMQSNGGLITGDEAEESAHTLILSGPAGGLIAAAAAGRSAGFPNVLTLDMGGTSCDVGLIVDGEPRLQYGTTVNGFHPLQLPLLDLHTIGAGGGSVAWVDAGGALKVGPRSAGAMPGPACYGRGGVEATVTDANLYLGRLNPSNFLGGDYMLYADAAERALAAVAEAADLELTRAAAGIVEVANANMVGALRVVSTRRGLDPRDFALVAFGGAGSLHATAIAREMGIKTVVVPPRAGLLSALGIVLSDVQHDYVRTWIAPAGADTDLAELGAIQQELDGRGAARLRSEGVPESVWELRRSLDLRYRGQEYSLNVPIGTETAAATIEQAVADFHVAHTAAYGHAAPDEPVEVVNVRLTAKGIADRPDLPWHIGAHTGEVTPVGAREVYFDRDGWQDTPHYDRSSLGVGARVHGPGVIEQMDTTLLIEPGQHAVVDAQGNMVITIEGPEHA